MSRRREEEKKKKRKNIPWTGLVLAVRAVVAAIYKDIQNIQRYKDTKKNKDTKIQKYDC